MTSLNLTSDDVKVLESTRSRLQQVVSGLQRFKDDIMMGQPLPPATSIQTSTTIIQSNLKNLTSYLADNAPLLERIAVHPSTNFPGRTQEGILLQLLRKKPEPAVETYLEAGLETAKRLSPEQWKNQRELWSWAREYCQERIHTYAAEETNEMYTVEEKAVGIENVRTGLRKNLEDESEDEEEDQEEEKERGAPVVDVEIGLRAGTLGNVMLPRGVELESKRQAAILAKGGRSGKP